MSTRQVTKWTTRLIALLTFITACAPSNQPLPSPTPYSPTPTQNIIPTSISTIVAPTPTEGSTCAKQAGHVESGKLESTNPPQEYLIYLPSCYNTQADKRYPVLYLLHGQTYTADQWIRLGAVDALDQISLSGESQPFILVFPDDRFWNLEAGPGFGDRLVNHLIPFIDETYRTLANRNHRAIGGLSRGSGWALQLGLTHWDLFSVIGLHSLAVFQGDGSRIENWLKEIPSSAYPTIFMDVGDNDPEFDMALSVESMFTQKGIPHEWHLYNGAHTEEYWSAHVAEYIGWYASQWNEP